MSAGARTCIWLTGLMLGMLYGTWQLLHSFTCWCYSMVRGSLRAGSLAHRVQRQAQTTEAVLSCAAGQGSPALPASCRCYFMARGSLRTRSLAHRTYQTRRCRTQRVEGTLLGPLSALVNMHTGCRGKDAPQMRCCHALRDAHEHSACWLHAGAAP